MVATHSPTRGAKLEMNLRELSHQQALRTLASVPALLSHADLTGRFTWLGGSWQASLGYALEELLGMGISDLVHPDDVERTNAAVQRLGVEKVLKDFENRLRHRDGHYEWIRWNSTLAEGYLASVAMVVTQDRQQREALLEKTELLLISERIARLGHWRVDLNTNALHWSEQVFRIHGLDPSEPQPDVQTAVNFYHPEDAALVEQHVQESMATGKPFDFELRLIRIDGVERTVESRGQVEYDTLGKPKALLGTFQDVTESKLVQKRLQEGERLASVSLLAAGIAHEINNPLQYVFANIGLAQEQLETLSQGGNSPWARRIIELLDDAMHGSKQVARIVGDLKSFMSRPQGVEALVDLNEVVKTTINMTRSEVRHRARMAESMGPVPKVKGDYAEFIQVFINLLTNAADAVESLGPDNARICLSCHTDAHGWAVIEVEDNGQGIPEQDQTRIFEPFFTTKPPGVGSGLGLHISRGIVERRGGSLTLRSTPGMTVFQVRLPPTSEETQPEPKAAPATRVLVIDDDPRVARTVARMLSNEYSCQVETDPRVALDLLLQTHFDAVVCDVMMPGLTGWELAMLAESQRPGIASRMLLMSGAATETHRPSDAPEIPLVSKPFGPADLRSALLRVLS